MAHEFIYTCYKLARFYPPDRTVLENISLSFYPGAKIGVLGSNGAGKSTLLKTLIGTAPPAAGRIVLGGEDITGLKPGAMWPHRRRIQTIFQDPYSSMNPRLPAGTIVGEPLQNFRFDVATLTVAQALPGGVFMALAILLLTTMFQVRFGLAPLKRISESLAAIRSGTAEKLSGTFPVEIAPLARETNAQLQDHQRIQGISRWPGAELPRKFRLHKARGDCAVLQRCGLIVERYQPRQMPSDFID